MAHRFLVADTPVPGVRLALDDGAIHHALRVLRLRDGETVDVFDGRGTGATGTLRVEGKRATVLVDALTARRTESPLSLTLAQCVSTGDRMDRTIEKAVELGVRRIVPLWSARTTVRLEGERATKRLAHWREIAVAACMQCGRDRLPEVSEAVPLDAFLRMDPDAVDASRARLVLSPRDGARLRTLPHADAWTLLTGPESGLSDEEEKATLRAGFQAVSLGPRVLRTETAGPAALAALGALFGDG